MHTTDLMATLRILGSAVPDPVAPHVAARLHAVATDDHDALLRLAGLLAPAQLAGRALLPDPLPDPLGGAAEPMPLAVERLLLAAALSTSDRLEVLLDATAIGVDALLRPPATEFLTMRDGRYAFAHERFRSMVVARASPADLVACHRALARAVARHGGGPLAAWHGILAGDADAARLAPRLLLLARSFLRRGAVDPAQRIAAAVAARGPSDARPQAFALASRAALWAARTEDAHEFACMALQLSSEADARAAGLRELSTIALLRDGPLDTTPSQSRFLTQMTALAPFVAASEDRSAFASLLEIGRVWWSDPEEADAVQARLSLTAARAREGWPTDDRPRPSPLAEAFVRVSQAGFQLQADDPTGAAGTLDDAVHRLPLGAVGGAVAVDGYRRADGTRYADLIAAFEAVAPTRREDAGGAAPGAGAGAGALTSAAVRVRDAAGAPADRDAFVRPVAELLARPDDAADGIRLSPRQLEISRLVVQGLRNAEIARRLGISARTVEVHLTQIFRKHGVRSRGELIARLLRSA